MMKYKGYLATVWFDDQADLFHGEVLNIRDVVTFQGKTVKELRRALRDSVEDYVAFCAERGEQPAKPFSGKFVVRVSPEVHHELTLAAKTEGKSLNAWVVERLARDLSRLRIRNPAVLKPGKSIAEMISEDRR